MHETAAQCDLLASAPWRSSQILPIFFNGYSEAFERDRPSALTAVYTVRSTVPALGTHVSAKLQRAIARVRFHDFDDHHP
jgi:hypothetical protein